MCKLFIEITYRVASADFDVNTDIKNEMLPEILAEYVHAQVGAGRDDREANHLDIYHIRIDLNLDGDVFTTSSDTGNDGLTLGIIMDVLGKLGSSYDVGREARRIVEAPLSSTDRN